MIQFRRTGDYARIRHILTEPRLWRAATDDHSPAMADWYPNMDPRIWYVIASDEAGEIGLYLLLAQNAILWELHCSVFPEALGPRAAEAGRALMPWAFEQTGAKRLTASIPRSNRLAIRYAKQCGLSEYGINPKSIERGGVLEDLILLGISPEEI